MALEGADAKPSAEIDTNDFSSLIGNISGFLTVVSQVQPFIDAKLGVPEWVALAVFGQKEEVSLNEFAQNLGTPGKRAKEIVNSLARNKLVSIDQSQGEREITIRVTDAGRAKFEEVSLQLKRLLSASLLGMEKSLVALSKGMLLLARSLQAGEPQRIKKGRKARRRTTATETER